LTNTKTVILFLFLLPHAFAIAQPAGTITVRKTEEPQANGVEKLFYAPKSNGDRNTYIRLHADNKLETIITGNKEVNTFCQLFSTPGEGRVFPGEYEFTNDTFYIDIPELDQYHVCPEASQGFFINGFLFFEYVYPEGIFDPEEDIDYEANVKWEYFSEIYVSEAGLEGTSTAIRLFKNGAAYAISMPKGSNPEQLLDYDSPDEKVMKGAYSAYTTKPEGAIKRSPVFFNIKFEDQRVAFGGSFTATKEMRLQVVDSVGKFGSAAILSKVETNHKRTAKK
jgi:hypothetical protein